MPDCPVAFGGDDTAAATVKQFAPAWMAYDMRVTAKRFQSDGTTAATGDVERLRQEVEASAPLVSRLRGGESRPCAERWTLGVVRPSLFVRERLPRQSGIVETAVLARPVERVARSSAKRENRVVS